jgi:hypothetical protein
MPRAGWPWRTLMSRMRLSCLIGRERPADGRGKRGRPDAELLSASGACPDTREGARVLRVGASPGPLDVRYLTLSILPDPAPSRPDTSASRRARGHRRVRASDDGEIVGLRTAVATADPPRPRLSCAAGSARDVAKGGRAMAHRCLVEDATVVVMLQGRTCMAAARTPGRYEARMAETGKQICAPPRLCGLRLRTLGPARTPARCGRSPCRRTGSRPAPARAPGTGPAPCPRGPTS